MMSNPIIQGSQNVFEDLGFSSEEAEHLIIRADLMLKLKTLIQERSWTFQQAAEKLQQPMERIEALMQGKIGQFQIEELIAMLTRAGMKIRIEVLQNVA